MRAVLVVVSSLFIACGGSAPPPARPAAPAPATAGDVTCPLEIAGTSLAVEDADGATVLVFVTTGAPDAVRQRGAALAAAHNERNGAAGAFGAVFSADSTAAASDIDGGVRVTFTAKDPAKAGAVGDELRMHAGHLAGASSCAM